MASDQRARAASGSERPPGGADLLPLPRTSAAPALARRHVNGACADWPDEPADVARLLTSELVTNAVVHGTGAVTLVVRCDGAALRVEVEDGDPTCPTPRTDPDTAGENGRGLALVAALADRWGAEPHAGGKRVWFELGG